MAEKSRAEILGENLARIRKEKGFSRKQLADVVKVTEIALGKYERGENLIPLDKIFKLADFLQVSVSSLTGENNFADSIPDVEKIVDTKIFEYRLKNAMLAADDAGYYPSKTKNGEILVATPEKIVHEADGSLSFARGNTIKFKNDTDFVKVVETAITHAISRDNTFNNSFRDIVFGKPK